jgi:hypothetical protein
MYVCLQREGSSGGDGQQEAEVDVNDVSLGVDEQVAIVAVLDQENVREQRVGRQTRREVLLGCEQTLLRIA